MSFTERKIDVLIALDGDTFDNKNNTISLSGLRCQATIQTYAGTTSSYGSNMQLRISGMLGKDMAKLSTLGFQDGVWVKNSIMLLAGDDDAGMTTVFTGGITSGSVDYNSMPDVGVDIIAVAGGAGQFAPIAANSYKGAMDVATMIQGIAQAGGYQFTNNGVNVKLSNHATSGTADAQIKDIALAAGIICQIENNTVMIWPPGGARDATVIDVSAANGLVGYPMYELNGGLDITTLFNPLIATGRKIKLTSSIPKPSDSMIAKFTGVASSLAKQNTPVPGATGEFYVWSVTHNISSQLPGGPWFTQAHLTSNIFNAHPNQ